MARRFAAADGGRRACCGSWRMCSPLPKIRSTWSEGEPLIVQSGKPIAVLATHARAPLVLMANCNLVGRWANEEVFYDLEQRGLICWGGLTAGCWQ
jgi:urocanate hydratase